MFGQVVIGPPASGKTAYCAHLMNALKHMNRRAILINLDPANDLYHYSQSTEEETPSNHTQKQLIPDIDISELICIAKVMHELELGPNGAMLYCIEYLFVNIEWLIKKLSSNSDAYLVIDCPGQVELFTHNNALKDILDRLSKQEFRLCVVHLVDAHHCTDAAKYISVVMLVLKTMFQLGLPQINVLSKVDLIESYGALAFDIEYYTKVQDLEYLLQHLDQSAFGHKFNALNRAMVELVEDFSLVAFHTLCIYDSDNIERIIRLVDKANGYVFGGLDKDNSVSLFGTCDSGNGDNLE